MACKKTLRPFIALVIFGSFFFSNPAFAKESFSKKKDALTDFSSPIQIHGETVEYFQAERKTIGTGHVTIDYQGTKLEADKITVYMDTKNALAEGHVTLTQKGGIFKGNYAEYDFERKLGTVDKMSATIPTSQYPYVNKEGLNVYPEYYGKARKIEKVSDKELRATDTYLTTCCGDSPFYKIEAREIDIFPEDKIVIRNALMYIKGIPVLFIPYYVQPMIDFNRLPVQLIPGKSHDWGVFLLSKWRYSLVNTSDFSVKGNVLLDYRDRRGFGEGFETFYRGDKIGHGVVRAYYANDKEPPANATPDRYRASWRHQSKLGPDTTLTTEINKLSDDTIIKDFFYRQEYEKNINPENYVSIITNKPEYTFSILERHRLDDFVTSVNRDPELRFDTHNREIMETPFYLRQEAQFDNLQKQYAYSTSENDASTTRFDLKHTLSYAGHVGSFAVTPRVSTRETFYSSDVDGSNSHVRSIVNPGLDISTRYYKTYDVFINKWGLDYNQIRHIVQPTLSYDYNATPTTFYTKLQQFDDIDSLDKQNIFRFTLKNDFQTKEHGAGGGLVTRDIARLEPYMDFNMLNSRIENVGYTAEINPYTWLGLQSDAVLDTHLGKVETANVDVYFTRGPWKVSVGQRYVLDDSSQTTAELDYKLRDWEFKAYERYEFQTMDSKEFEFTISKYWSCIITDYIYNHSQANGDTFYFAIRLKAFPTTPFSLRQSYAHPKAYNTPTI